jgi:hypothetical protein
MVQAQGVALTACPSIVAVALDLTEVLRKIWWLTTAISVRPPLVKVTGRARWAMVISRMAWAGGAGATAGGGADA